MGDELGSRLRRGELGAELEFLERRRKDYPYTRRVEEDYDGGFSLVVQRVIDEKSAIRKRRGLRSLAAVERKELYRRVRADFFACLSRQEQTWVDNGQSVTKQWQKVLSRQLPHNGRNSLRRIAELHARDFLRQG